MILVRSFDVAVGKMGSPSPIGDYRIECKIVNPTWYPPDHRQPPIPPGPQNPLGKYWLGLNIQGYGIHGNTAPQSIGYPASLGCFRMRNSDIQYLFQLIPTGTLVQIKYQTMNASIDSNYQAWLELYPDIYNIEDREWALLEALNELKWAYQPHRKALNRLLMDLKRPSKLMIPREINIDSNMDGIDGFYWNGDVFVAREILDAYPHAVAGTLPIKTDPVFMDYIAITKTKLFGGFQVDWNEPLNLLKINHYPDQEANAVNQ